MFTTTAAFDHRCHRALAAALLVTVLAGCVASYTAPANPHLDGNWRLDASASDYADARISTAIAAAESKLRQRLVSAGYSQYGSPEGDKGGRNQRSHGGSAPDTSDAGSAELNGNEFTATGYIGPDFEGLQRQLQLLLDAPKQLTIAVLPESVRIASDKAPVRDYPVGEAFTRMDEYGTARIDTKWSGDTFELRAKYSNRAVVTEHYRGDGHAHTLTLTVDLNDPVAGKLSVRSVYRQ